jgi:hypothetical protein
MIIVVDLARRSVLLSEPEDFGRFSMEVVGQGGDDVLAEVVGQANLGRVLPDGTHAVVDPGALRALAGSSATAQWDQGFDAMCAYAAEKGWVEADGGIRAHIERGGA